MKINLCVEKIVKEGKTTATSKSFSIIGVKQYVVINTNILPNQNHLIIFFFSSR